MRRRQDTFLYQINFNRKKYPEICEALEEAKKNNGIAFYLRKLISKDIEARKKKSYIPNQQQPEQIEEQEIKMNRHHYSENKESSLDLPDDSGGFL